MPRQRSGSRTHPGGEREAILVAARILFLDQGSAGASVDAVTLASGVSKPTVHAHFPTKEALLEGMVRAKSEKAEIPATFRATGEPRHDLERAAQDLLALPLAPEALAWDRMMAGEARRRSPPGGPGNAGPGPVRRLGARTKPNPRARTKPDPTPFGSGRIGPCRESGG